LSELRLKDLMINKIHVTRFMSYGQIAIRLYIDVIYIQNNKIT